MVYKHISFATKNMLGSLKALSDSANIFGVPFTGYTEKDIDPEFVKENNHIFNGFDQRGGGFWLWKPWLILNELLNSNDGDIIMYTDAGMCMVKDPTPLFKLAEDIDVVYSVFHNVLLSGKVKRDCLIRMDCDSSKYYNSPVVNAALQIYKVNEDNIKFLQEYLKWCSDIQCVSDTPSTLDRELPTFVDHFHDQSILSILVAKYDIDTSKYKDIHPLCNTRLNLIYKDIPESNIFLHHRLRYSLDGVRNENSILGYVPKNS